STCCSLRTARTWPTISPGVRLRLRPRRAVMQNLQSTAQPTWEETQMVARRGLSRREKNAGPSTPLRFARDDKSLLSSESSSSPESEPSPASPPSPSGIQTVSTDWPSGKENRYRTVPSEEVNFISIVGWPTE